LAIPATYGAGQREALKNSVNEATNRDDVQILTRPVAAAVINNNQRNNENNLTGKSNANAASSTSFASNTGESFRVVFDITEGSMDASVIRVKDSKDFHVVSNVGDTNFGMHDLDERIVEYIINEKSKRRKRFKKTAMQSESDHDLETVNAYANLVKYIKQHVEQNGAVSVDLDNGSGNGENGKKSNNRKENELYIDKLLISDKLCKDIYDWALAHIEKSIVQADLNDKDIEEILIIGERQKMPGFSEYLKQAYPFKRIAFVKEEELAVGASIVVSLAQIFRSRLRFSLK
jgi:molecular chaperone DnaK (HSP70)